MMAFENKPLEVWVRQANLEDLQDLIYLGRKTFIETYKGSGNRPEGLEEAYGLETYNANKLKPLLVNQGFVAHIFLIGSIDDEAAGFAKLNFHSIQDWVPNKNSVHLELLYILKKFQGAGLGRKLMDEVETLASSQGYTGIWLGVWDGNEKAIRYYTRAGYKIVGSCPWRYQYGDIPYQDTDLVMYRDLRS